MHTAQQLSLEIKRTSSNSVERNVLQELTWWQGRAQGEDRSLLTIEQRLRCRRSQALVLTTCAAVGTSSEFMPTVQVEECMSRVCTMLACCWAAEAFRKSRAFSAMRSALLPSGGSSATPSPPLPAWLVASSRPASPVSAAAVGAGAAGAPAAAALPAALWLDAAVGSSEAAGDASAGELPAAARPC